MLTLSFDSLVFLKPTCTILAYKYIANLEKLQEVANVTTGITKMISTWAKSEAAAYWDSMEYNNLQQCFNITRDIPLT